MERLVALSRAGLVLASLLAASVGAGPARAAPERRASPATAPTHSSPARGAVDAKLPATAPVRPSGRSPTEAIPPALPSVVAASDAARPSVAAAPTAPENAADDEFAQPTGAAVALRGVPSGQAPLKGRRAAATGLITRRFAELRAAFASRRAPDWRASVDDGVSARRSRLARAQGAPVWKARAVDFLRSTLPLRPDGATAAGRLKLGARMAFWKFLIGYGGTAAATALGLAVGSNYRYPVIDDYGGLVGFVSVLALGVLIEEILFRVLAYGVPRWILAKTLGKTAALVVAGSISTILFVAVHETGAPALIALRVVGSILQLYAFERGGLLASYATHLGYDLLFLLAMLSAPSLLFGGFSATLLGVVVAGAFLLAAWLHDRRRLTPDARRRR